MPRQKLPRSTNEIGPRGDQGRSRSFGVEPESGLERAEQNLESPGKTQIEVFVEQVKREEPALHEIVAKLQETMAIRDQEASPVPFPEIPAATSEEIEARIEALAEESRTSFSFREARVKAAWKLIEETKAIELDSLSDSKALDRQVGKLNDALNRIKQLSEKTDLYSFHEKISRLAPEYSRLKLAEAGYQSDEALTQTFQKAFDDYHRQSDQVTKLYRRFSGFGRIVYFRAIKRALRKENNARREVDRLSRLRELSYSGPKRPRLDFPGRIEQEKEVNQLKVAMAEIVIEKITKRYESLLVKAEDEAPQAIQFMDDGTTRKITDRYIDRFILKKEQNLSRPELPSEARAILHQVFEKDRNRDRFSPNPDEIEELDELEKRLKVLHLSDPIQRAITESLNYFKTSGKTPRQHCQSYWDFASDDSRDWKYRIAGEAYSRVLRNLARSLPDRPDKLQDFKSDLWLKDRELGQQLESRSRPARKLITDFNADLWSVFKETIEKDDALPAESIKGAEQYLVQQTLGQLLAADNRYESGRLAAILTRLDPVKSAPFAILNEYSAKTPNYGLNQYPSNEFSAFIASLTDSRLQELAESAIPGLNEVVNLIKNNPENYYQASIRSDKGKSVPNPVDGEIQKNLVKIANHLLANSLADRNHETIPFLVRFYKQTDANLQEGYELLSKAFLESDFPDSTIMVEYIEQRSVNGDYKVASLLFENLDNLDSSSRWKVASLAHKMVKFLVWGGTVSSNFLENLGRCLKVTGKELYQFLSFCSSIQKPDQEQGLLYFDQHLERSRDLYEALIASLGTRGLLGRIFRLQKEQGAMLRGFSDGFMRSLRKQDPVLENAPPERLIPEETSYRTFYESLTELLGAVYEPTGKLANYGEIYTSPIALRFLARQPEKLPEIIGLPKVCPKFMDLIRPGGPYGQNRDFFLSDIFENGDPVRRAKDIEKIFVKKVPYWQHLYLFTLVRIGENLRAAVSEYPITEVAQAKIENIVRRHQKTKKEAPDKPTRLEAIFANRPEIVKRLEAGEIFDPPFAALTGIYKELVYRDYLRKTIETSRSLEAKEGADRRNRDFVRKNQALSLETFQKRASYIHGSAADYIESVLLNGNLPKESLGDGAYTDSYPFQVDFSRLDQEFLNRQSKVNDVFLNSMSARYGRSGVQGADGQLWYIYDRDNTSWEKGKVYTTGTPQHGLMLGGIPATEISAIVLRSPATILNKVKSAISESGFYVPVYDLSGKILFSPKEYDQVRADQNLKIPVEVWDYQLKTGGGRGSNPGGEFTVPTREQPIKYYVKLGGQFDKDWLWNEQLADNIYRAAGLPTPETKIVRVEGTYGHASRILDGHEPSQEEYARLLKSGFVIDAWLANWDIAAKTDNTLVAKSDGKIVRIDNGGALLFRARGERKTDFGSIVIELETMKRSYGELTDEAIKEQLASLRQFTNERIDHLVDGVRLKTADRDRLKQTLKDRRDYILSTYS